MKEMIHQEKNNYIFWKIEEDYSLLFLKNKKRKKEVEYKLTGEERERYYEEGLDLVRELAGKF